MYDIIYINNINNSTQLKDTLLSNTGTSYSGQIAQGITYTFVGMTIEVHISTWQHTT